jgi:FlaA1/EpsC-like NDP-sugar epimerase
MLPQLSQKALTIDNPWAEKVVLVTGAVGTIGHEIISQLIPLEPRSIIGIDNNETELFFAKHTFSDWDHVSFALTDVSDIDGLKAVMDGVDIVIHTAGLKHVGLSEQTPHAAIQVNVLGTYNVIQAAHATGVQRVLFTSSDKAVNPTSVMGTSKLMAERLMTAASTSMRPHSPIFASSRFGNVLGSRGSVIPLFRRQIAAGGPVTLTDRQMTRFIMTLREAVQLVMESVFLAKGGEVFITKMPIEDMALIMIEELAPVHGHEPQEVHIRTVGPRPGEKMYEELMNEEEVRRTIELENHFVVVPAFHRNGSKPQYVYPKMRSEPLNRPYNSSTSSALTREELREYLLVNGFLETPRSERG